MARAPTMKAAKPAKSTTVSRKPVRSPAVVPKKGAPTAKRVAAKRPVAAGAAAQGRKSPLVARSPAVAAPRGAKVSKPSIKVAAGATASKPRIDALAAQIAKLEQSVSALSAKSNKASKLAEVAAMRILEMAARVADLEAKLAAAPAAGPQVARVEATEVTPQVNDADPGDWGPQDAAVQKPAPIDDEAAGEALENPEPISLTSDTSDEATR
jgi:hypothetical protein